VLVVVGGVFFCLGGFGGGLGCLGIFVFEGGGGGVGGCGFF